MKETAFKRVAEILGESYPEYRFELAEVEKDNTGVVIARQTTNCGNLPLKLGVVWDAEISEDIFVAEVVECFDRIYNSRTAFNPGERDVKFERWFAQQARIGSDALSSREVREMWNTRKRTYVSHEHYVEFAWAAWCQSKVA